MQEASFDVRLDPRLTDVTQTQLQEQLDLAVRIRDRMDELFEALRHVRSMRDQVHAAAERAELAGNEEIAATAEELIAELDAVEAQLIQPKAESGQDLFNLEPQLASNYAQVYGYVTGPDNYGFGGPDRQPTAGMYQRIEDLEPRWSAVTESPAHDAGAPGSVQHHDAGSGRGRRGGQRGRLGACRNNPARPGRNGDRIFRPKREPKRGRNGDRILISPSACVLLCRVAVDDQPGVRAHTRRRSNQVAARRGYDDAVSRVR